MKPETAKLLDHVFGPGEGADPSSRAAHSSREYVRSIDQIALATAGARGRRLTAREAFDAYGFEVLREVADEESAPLCADVDAAGRMLRERRVQLGLRVDQVARRASLSPKIIEALEKSHRRPVREYELTARVLGLDERMISYSPEPVGNDGIVVRLRTLRKTQRSVLTAPTVGALAEAAWVAATQVRLERMFRLDVPEVNFKHSDDYGAPGWPPWRAGFELAGQVRQGLALNNTPIESMRDICERRLRVPVIQTELGEELAGATIESDGCRAVVLNLSGRNREVFVRRATLAHELAHILFDPPRHLNDLRVDRYDDLARRVDQIVDRVEQRANAFAIELIAPQHEVVQRYETTVDEPLRAVMDHFGISFTAARYQVWNGLERRIPFDTISTANHHPDPSWEGREAYTIDYHPIRSLASHPSRAGRFSAITLRAASERMISWDTASEWLLAPEAELRAAEQAVRELFPDVFA